MHTPKKEHLETILLAATMAPSADNSQPWFFTLEKSTIFLHHDHENTHANHIYNINYFADFVSLGGVLENISQQANSLGYEAEISLLEYAKGLPLAKIDFHSISTTTEKQKGLNDSIVRRKTNRRAYQKKNIPEEILSFAQQIASRKEASLQWITSKKDIRKFANIIASHDVVLWEDEELRKNLLRMLRFENKEHPEGLSLRSLELGFKQYFFKPAIFLAARFPFLWKLLALGSVTHTKHNLASSGALGILTIPKSANAQTYLEGGQAFQAVWLELSKKNLAIQPLFGPLAFILNGKLPDGKLSSKHEKIRKEIDLHFNSHFPELSKETPVAFFRAGYAKKPSALSGRKKLTALLKK